MIDLKQLTKSTLKSRVNKFKSEHELQVWLAQDFRNLVQYANWKLNHQTGKIQLYVADELQEGNNKLLLMCFRGSSKSYLVDLYCLWRWHRYVNTKILILSSIEGNAAKHVRRIKNLILTLPALHYLEFSKCTETGFQLKLANAESDLSLNTAGIFSSIESSRADVVIADDCEVKQNSESDMLREKLTNRLSEVQAILHPSPRWSKFQPELTQFVCIGTPQSEFSVYNVPEDSETPHPLQGCKIVKIPCLDDKNQSTFPERFTVSQLRTKQLGMSKPEWALQMLLDSSLLDKESRVIDLERLVTCEAKVSQVICCVDPAGDKKAGGGDEHAYCVGGMEVGANPSRVHVLELGGSREPIEIFFKNLIKTCRKHRVWKIKIDSRFSGWSSMLRKLISEASESFVVEDIFDSKNKAERLVDILDPTINGQRVSFEPYVISDKTNDLQFRSWTYKALPKYDDRLDALAYLVNHFLENKQLNWGVTQKWETAKIEFR